MKRYRDFQPTSFDSRANYIGDTSHDHWFVAPVSINRDTECAIALSNWEAVIKDIQADKTPGVEIHRFGHWACGWYELILVHPWRKDILAKLEDTERALADYPILNESLWSEKEQELIQENWESWGNNQLNTLLCDYFECEEIEEKHFNNLKELIQQRSHYDVLDSDGSFHESHIKYLLNEKISQEEIDRAFAD